MYELTTPGLLGAVVSIDTSSPVQEAIILADLKLRQSIFDSNFSVPRTTLVYLRATRDISSIYSLGYNVW